MTISQVNTLYKKHQGSCCAPQDLTNHICYLDAFVHEFMFWLRFQQICVSYLTMLQAVILNYTVFLSYIHNDPVSRHPIALFSYQVNKIFYSSFVLFSEFTYQYQHPCDYTNPNLTAHLQRRQDFTKTLFKSGMLISQWTVKMTPTTSNVILTLWPLDTCHHDDLSLRKQGLGQVEICHWGLNNAILIYQSQLSRFL